MHVVVKMEKNVGDLQLLARSLSCFRRNGKAFLEMVVGTYGMITCYQVFCKKHVSISRGFVTIVVLR